MNFEYVDLNLTIHSNIGQKYLKIKMIKNRIRNSGKNNLK